MEINLSDEIKRDFFRAVIVSILLYGCTTLTLRKRIEKKLVGNCTKCYELYWRNPARNIPQNSRCTATKLLLYFDLRPGPKCHSRGCTGRTWHILMAVMRGNRVGGNWLMKWDELKKSHGTLIDWCTGREWPINCMTVISAWWRLNIRSQRSSGRRTII